MASHRLDYQPFPSVNPSGVPDAKAHVSTNAETFGGSIGQAAEGLGKAFEHAGAQTFDTVQFFDQVAGDDGLNQYIEGRTKIMHGDPSAQAPGPDGAMQPDLGYLGLKGQAALNAREPTQQKLDELYNNIRDGLSPQARRHFESAARRYHAQSYEQLGSHADREAGSYYTSVNKATADANLNAISLSPNDDKAVDLATNSLINARVKQAQLAGGGQPQVDEAIRSAKADALKVRVLTISATDPLAAKTLLEKNRETAGLEFEPLYRHVESRADQQQGIGVANEVMAKTKQGKGFADARLPIFAQASQSVPGSMSPQGLARLVHIESGGKATAGAGSKHEGLVQASDDWWRQFGQGSKFDPEQAIMAAARATAHDRPILARALGRDPTDGELYLAHQQGPKGAAALFTFPNLPAAVALVNGGAYKSMAVARQAIKGNGGDPDAPASAFTSMWVKKFGGDVSPGSFVSGPPQLRMPPELSGPAPVAPPSGPKPSLENPTLAPEPMRLTKTDAYNEIMARTDLSEQAKSYAVSHLNQMYSMQQAQEVQEERARKIASDKAADAAMMAIGQGVTPELVAQIWASPALDWHTKHSLVDIAEKRSSGEGMGLGPGYAEALRRIDPMSPGEGRITDPKELIHMVANQEITHSGYEKLKTMLHDVRNNSDASGAHTTHSEMLKLAESKIVGDEFDGKKYASPEQWAIYRGRFVPAFEARYDAWVKSGKNPFEFLTAKNVDETIASVVTRAELARAKLSAAQPGEAGAVVTAPAPDNVDEKGWQDVVSKPPAGTKKIWSAAVADLVADPSPEAMREFDEYFGPRKAPTAENILKGLGVAVKAEAK